MVHACNKKKENKTLIEPQRQWVTHYQNYSACQPVYICCGNLKIKIEKKKTLRKTFEFMNCLHESMNGLNPSVIFHNKNDPLVWNYIVIYYN